MAETRKFEAGNTLHPHFKFETNGYSLAILLQQIFKTESESETEIRSGWVVLLILIVIVMLMLIPIVIVILIVMLIP